MAITTIDQLSEVYKNTAGEVKFRITTRFLTLKEGDLPYTTIFVYTITAPTDPKSDVFSRIGNISDLTTLPLTRESAVAQNKTSYLASNFSVTYDDVQTATSAKALIQSRIDQLITDWLTYQNKFVNPRETELPATSSTIIQAAENSYYVAAADQAKKDAALSVTSAAYQQANAALAAALTAQSLAQQSLSVWNALLKALNTHDYASAIDIANAQLDNSQLVLETTTANLATATAAANTANLAWKTAESDAAAAKVKTEAALAYALSVCPTFVP